MSGRQQLVELVAEQADLEQTFNPSDPDCVDRLLQCTRQAVPLFSVSSLFYTWYFDYFISLKFYRYTLERSPQTFA